MCSSDLVRRRKQLFERSSKEKSISLYYIDDFYFYGSTVAAKYLCVEIKAKQTK